MTRLFVAALAVIAYTYAGYPLLIAVMAQVRPRRWEQGPVAGAASVILPVHNGMKLLPARLAALCAMPASLLQQIIVVVDGGDDGAGSWLAAVNDPRVLPIVLPLQQGKSAALRHGMEQATGDYLLFVDVRPEVAEASVRQLLSNFADPSVGCAAGELRVLTDATGAAASVGGLYWRYEQAIRNCESAYDSPVGVYGGFYAIRRSLAVLPPDGLILDDMFQPLWIIRKGFRSIVDTSARVTDRWPSTSAGEFQRKVRTLAGNFQLCAMAPWTLGPRNRVLLQFVSHKLLRLVVPYCMIAMLVSAGVLALHSVAWLACALLQIAVLLVALLGDRAPSRPVQKLSSALGALLLLNAAAVWALWTYLTTRGPLWKIWKATPASAQSAPLT